MGILGAGIGAILVLVLGGWLIWRLIGELRTGEANAAGVIYRRSANPAMYWITISAQCFFVFVCVAALVRIAQRVGQ